ncbi:hypothetical protein [Microbacterium sp. W4I20]|uniref:hypothetical protein n=1 Tax=Microbacterium sp. W4I20 TaxID=3042262 RepID=UPI00277F2B17|nr:hypothetical protein [Microbacterium sp. W4I20]MDQ0726810.1 hypothetical protein [Microbacterium sp. W4I20]
MLAHFTAFKALLLAVSMLSNKVFSNIRVTNGTPVRANYIVLFPDGPADLDDGRFTAQQRVESRARYRYDVRIVAVDADGLLLLADAVMSLIGKTPVIVGRTSTPVVLVPGVEEGKGRYDSVTDLHYLDLSFEFWSQPA